MKRLYLQRTLPPIAAALLSLAAGTTPAAEPIKKPSAAEYKKLAPAAGAGGQGHRRAAATGRTSPRCSSRQSIHSSTGLRTLREWRRDPESNRTVRICNPLHCRFAIAPNKTAVAEKLADPQGFEPWMPGSKPGALDH